MPYHKFDQAPKEQPGYCKCGFHQTHPEHNESAPIVDDTSKMLLGRIETLLQNHGKWSQCAGLHCRQPVYWLVSNANKKIAYNPDGTVHFDSCLEQKTFMKEAASRG